MMGKKLAVDDWTINDILELYVSNGLFVDQKYQRKLVWSLSDKELFIDSLIKKFPIPNIMMVEYNENEKITYGIIDGLQRINAIISFMLEEFPIVVNGKSGYFDITATPSTFDLQQEGKLIQKEPVLDKQICIDFRGYKLPIISTSHDTKTIDEIFKRLNSTGTKLSKHDLRQAGALNKFSQLVREISSTVRGSKTLSDIVTLETMPKISLSNSGYSSNDVKENKEIYDLYVQKYLEDIRSFGEATAIYQRRNDKLLEKRKSRRPILLVPACTTRTVDYYVFGQGFYLSAGLKTVFCNSVGTGGRGGSCFIGPDSWDDYKINKNEFLMQNTIYHGLKPGIYMQTEPDKCRGALGSEEQALLICDVQPHLDKGNPNAESMMSAFSLVAHIPVFEEKRYVGQSDGKDGKSNIKCYGKCEKQRYCHDMVEENLKQYLGDIESYCKKYEAELGYRLSAQDENAKKDKIIEKMKALGEYYKSDWFIKRAEYYAKYRWTYPQAWPPPTLTDWLFIETDYEKFRKKEIDADLGECRIQIPEYED